jgi:hypothetical protein
VESATASWFGVVPRDPVELEWGGDNMAAGAREAGDGEAESAGDVA